MIKEVTSCRNINVFSHTEAQVSQVEFTTVNLPIPYCPRVLTLNTLHLASIIFPSLISGGEAPCSFALWFVIVTYLLHPNLFDDG